MHNAQWSFGQTRTTSAALSEREIEEARFVAVNCDRSGSWPGPSLDFMFHASEVARAIISLFRDYGKEDWARIFHDDALVARTSPPNSIGIHTSWPTLTK